MPLKLSILERTFTYMKASYPLQLMGVPLANHIQHYMKEQLNRMTPIVGRPPKLSIILASQDPASQTYVKKKVEACRAVGIQSEVIKLENDFQTIKNYILQHNEDSQTDGILLQLPVTDVETTELMNLIHPDKDVDGMHDFNVGCLAKGRPRFIPCTPLGLYVLLRCYGINTKSTHVVIVGKSDIVGSPLAALMSRLGNSSVTIMDGRMSPDAAEAIMSTAGILVVATGTPEKFDTCRKGAVVVDVGINRVLDGLTNKTRLVGDVDINAILPLTSAYTPVPGGIGPMTCTMVLFNTYLSYRCKAFGEDVNKAIETFLNDHETSPKRRYFIDNQTFEPPSFAHKFKILLVSSAYNGMSQRVEKTLTHNGYNVSMHVWTGEDNLRSEVKKFNPHLIIAPMLKQKIPADIYERIMTWIVHPGIAGDRGPSSIDWAILNQKKEWGVTVLEASEVMDGGPIWATQNFKTSDHERLTKSEFYNRYSVGAAVLAIYEALDKHHRKLSGKLLDYEDSEIKGRLMPTMKQSDRAIDWSKFSSDEIQRKINASDGSPGVLTKFEDEKFYIYNAFKESGIRGDFEPGSLIGHRNGSVLIATKTGSIWIGHAKKYGQGNFKLPAYDVLPIALTSHAMLLPISLNKVELETFQDISYEHIGEIGVVSFDFYNGAFSKHQSARLAQAIVYARSQPIKILILKNNRYAWSNGIDLNTIEAAADPNQETMSSINAIDDVAEALLRCHDQITICCLGGSAGAGGVAIATAADLVVAPDCAVFNPHYRNMGLYGSEFWTYSFPKRIGRDVTEKIVENCQAMTAKQAKRIGFVDFVVKRDEIERFAMLLASSMLKKWENQTPRIKELFEKNEEHLPLSFYRVQELEMMKKNVFDDCWGYAEKRKKFVLKLK